MAVVFYSDEDGKQSSWRVFLFCRECRSAACSSKVYGLGLISLWLTVGKHTAYRQEACDLPDEVNCEKSDVAD